MKLKYKLLISYFALIAIFSASLFFLLIEIRAFSLALQNHVRQDVQSIIDLSEQLQHLEILNSNYIVLFIPGNTNEKIVELEKSRQQYARFWEKVKKNLQQPLPFFTFDRFLLNGLRRWSAVDFLYTPEENKALLSTVNQKWLEIDRRLKQSIEEIRKRHWEKARYIRDVYVQQELKALRQNLIKLNRQIGNQSIKRSQAMARMTGYARQFIFYLELFLFAFAVLTGIFVARRITRPIEALKEGVERMAVNDFSVTIGRKSNDEIGELSGAFEQLSKRLREADRFKAAMLSQFTHEMKSPLGSIKQATMLLEKSLQPGASTNQKRFLDIIKGNYQTLQRLITNILRSASYDMGQIQLKYQRVDLVRLVTEQLIYLSPMIKEKNIKVNISFSARTINAEIDPEKMKEVVQNLMTNAVKFSPKDSTIDLKLKEKFPLIYLSVQDQGIGIPEKEIPYIFEKLYRASNSDRISVKGTGLGLYITAQIVRTHGGKIKVKSKVGQGSRFEIILPKTRQVAEEGGWLNEAT